MPDISSTDTLYHDQTTISAAGGRLTKNRKQRINDRKIFTKTCKGTFNNGADGFDGKLIDLSFSGCRISLPKNTKVFDSFILKLPVNGLERQCKVMWRFNQFVGAEFIKPKDSE